jgi:signal transduction histidine kinase
VTIARLASTAAVWERIRRTDLLLPALFGVAGTAELAVQEYAPVGVGLATYWLAVLVLCVRRAFPLVTPLLVGGIYALTPLLGFDVSEPASWIPVLALACFAAGAHVPRSRAPLGFASVAGMLAIVFLTLDWLTDFDPDVLFGLLFSLGPWVLGVALREALERNAELAVEAERARVEGEQAAAAAAAAERERIARELHDVLAHSLSVIVVQASLAEDLAARDAERALDALKEVQQTGRDALAETGRLLRLIRDEEDELGLRPQHAVADLPALADEYARAGLKIDLSLDPGARTLPLGVGLSAYRIVQEALTNALKHAPGSHVRVRLERRADAVALEVVNDAGTGAPAVRVTSGHGLVGVRERVSLFGGDVQVGPTEGGGFRLAATLPTPPQAA